MNKTFLYLIILSLGLFFQPIQGQDFCSECFHYNTDFDSVGFSQHFVNEAFQSFKEIDEDYRLKVGDSVIISLYGEGETKQEIAVDPRGMITYLYAESIPALGKTIPELREELEKELRKYYRFTKLLITPNRFTANYFTIAGEVLNPGRKPMIGKPTVLSAFCQANGLKMAEYRNNYYEMGDLTKTFLARKGNYIPIDFVRLLRYGDMSQNIPLEPGDYIYVPSVYSKQVFVVGEVYGPLVIDYLDSLTLVGAIAEAGDVTEYASSRVIVLRGSLACPVKYLIDYNKIIKGCSPDFCLQAGDIVYVPPRHFTNLRELMFGAGYTFVGAVFSSLGVHTWDQVHHHTGSTGGEKSENFFLEGGGFFVD